MNILDSRILLKRSTTAGATPTVPASSSHTDGTWVNTDIYEGELFLNTADARLFTRQGSNIKEIGLQNSLIGTTQYAVKTLTSAEILTLNTNPVTLISAPGAGKFIIVKNGLARINFNTTAYAGGTTYLYLQFNGSSNYTGQVYNIIQSTITRQTTFVINRDLFTGISDNDLLANTALKVTADSNPTTGNSTIDILIEYQILDLDTIF